MSGILVVQDVVQNPEKQTLKAYYGEVSTLPDGSEIGAHTAEVLRLVEGAQIPEGGWVREIHGLDPLPQLWKR